MAASGGEVGNMQEAALRRKEKLQALKEKQTKGQVDNQENSENTERLPRPIFRSYQPQDETLKEAQLPRVKPLEVKEKMKETLEDAKSEQVVEEVDLGNLAPRKPDWDLKRDIAKKLEKLERRTQRAIAELIKERLQAGEEDLAAAVAAGPDAINSLAATSTTEAAAEADRDFYMDEDDNV